MTIAEPQLSDEQSTFCESIDRLADRHVAPVAATIDADGEIDGELAELLLANELHQIDVPESLGGSGGDLETALLLVRSLARASGSVALPVVGSHVYSAALARSTSHAQETASSVSEGVWPAIADGGEFPVVARAKSGGYVLEGVAPAVEDALRSDRLLVLAEVDGDPHLFDLPCKAADVGEPLSRTGLRGVDCRRVTFDSVVVGASSDLGRPAAVAAVNWGRLGAAAVAVGLAEAALAQATAYVRERRQFGRPIAEFPAVRAMIATIESETRAAWTAVRVVASAPDPLGESGSGACAWADALARTTVFRAATTAVQLHGGYGYTVEFAVERIMRDAISARARGGRVAAALDPLADELLGANPISR